MDISCIISSGDLELYVLGMLSEEDNLKVAQLAQMFPEIKTEIETIEQLLLQISDEADAPSTSVKDNLFARLASVPVSETPQNTSEKNNENATPYTSEATVLSMPQPPAKRSRGLLAASVIAFIACAGVIAYLVNQNSHYNTQVNDLKARTNVLQQNADHLWEQNNAFRNGLALYQDTAFQKIDLASVPGKPKALVQIFWNRVTKDVYAANISLPVAPAGKQYQLWALIDGKPVNAGMITKQALPQRMIDFSKADAFAITLENEGGSPTPHLDQLYVLGKTS